MGTQYYVSTTGSDANAGTSTATAKLTISGAAAVVAAGDTINVLSGNYQGSIYLSSAQSPNGTSASPVTVVSPVQWAAKIMPLSPTGAGSGNGAAFEIRRDYWVIDGFEIDGSAGYTGSGRTWTIGGTEWGLGIYLTGNNCVVIRNKVHDLGRSTAIEAAGGSGIEPERFYGGGNFNIIDSNYVYRIGHLVGSNTHVQGIYNTSHDNTVRNNLVHTIDADGITSWHGATRCYYYNNTVFNCNNGITLGSGDSGASSATGGCSDSRVFNNIIYDCNYAMIMNGGIGSGNLVDYNMAFLCPNGYALASSITATNRISSSPSFINYIAGGGGDYHLSLGSAAINAGIGSLGTIAAASLDFDSVVRPLSGTWELGAYEFGNSATASTPTATVLFDNAQITAMTAVDTLNLTLTAATNAVLLVAVGGKDTTGAVSAMAYNGVALTRLVQTTNGSIGMNMEIWGLTAPAAGANIISANFSTAGTVGWVMLGATYTNARTSNPFGTANSATASAVTATINISSSTTDKVFVGIGCVQYISATNATIRGSIGSPNNWGFVAGDVDGAIVASISAVLAGASVFNWALAAVPILASTPSYNYLKFRNT